MNLFLCVEEFQRASKGITNLNSGGCGIYAYFLGKHLSELGFQVSFRVSYRWIENRDWGRQFKLGLGFDHVLVEVADGDGKIYHIDSKTIKEADGICTSFGGELYENHLDFIFLKNLVRDADWNWVFDRRQIPKLRRNFSLAFRRICSMVAG